MSMKSLQGCRTLGSRDECRTAPDGRGPLDQAHGLEPKTLLFTFLRCCTRFLEHWSVLYVRTQALHSETFIYVNNLRVLNLAGNLIEFLYDRAFDGLSNLLSLSLANNRINYLPENVFSSLANLSDLLLHNNRLEFVWPRTFVGLRSLRRLRLTLTFALSLAEEYRRRYHLSPSTSNLCCRLHLPPAVLVSCCPHFFLQIYSPSIPWSPSSSVALWCLDGAVVGRRTRDRKVAS